MNIRQIGLYLFIFIPLFVTGQTSPQYTSSEIKLGLKKLNVVGSALYIAAHPDDENTRLLAFLAKEKKFRTSYLSLTRGDGGQNLIGNEQSELLGLIRTQELLAARRTDGAEQYFSRAVDFGFSKTSDETFRIWDKEQILADAVWVIRKLRPDIIITRFPEDSRAGHGQHAASAIIAREAFIAAADPKRFPEQLKFVEAWQAKRILWNTYNFGGFNTTSNDQLKLNVGAFNHLLGKGYGEIAAESRTHHKSQGFGSAKQRGEAFEYFVHTAGEAAQKDILEGINSSWSRIPGGEKISDLIKQADQNFNSDNPSASVPSLINILNQLEKLPQSDWKDHKIKELKDLILGASGLWFESCSNQASYAMGDSIQVRTDIVLQSALTVKLVSVDNKAQGIDLKNGELKSFKGNALAHQITNPYWLNENHPLGMYAIRDLQMIGHPENQPVATVGFVFNIGGKDLSYKREVIYKYTDQVRGEIYQPLIIAPAVTASLNDKAFVLADNTTKTIQVQLKSYKNNSSGVLIPALPEGWNIEPKQLPFQLNKKGDEQTVQFVISPKEKASTGKIVMNLQINGKVLNRGSKVVDYEHIPLQTTFPLSEAQLSRMNLKTGGKRLGYIAGAGDLIPESLQQIGYEVNFLNEAEVMNGNLNQYDAIITGVRAYNVNERLTLMQPKLIEYVNKGGVLLVQYNVNNPLLIEQIGPYPFRISRDRVAEEDAKVSMLEKDHPVLNYPNKITSEDFDGWIQERGLYFTSEADSKYSRILSMNDRDESPKDGSLLVTNFGKGRFVYTSLSFFRELPAGVPGAYRLFVNLITINKAN